LKAGHHAANHARAAMIGYVQDRDIPAWASELDQRIAGLESAAIEGWSASDKLAVLEHNRATRTASLRSDHARRTGLGRIRIDHIWIEMRFRTPTTAWSIMLEQGVIGRDDAIILINEQIAAHSGGILAAPAPFEAASALSIWHGIIRDIEEFINLLMNGIDDERLLASLASLPLGDVLAANPQMRSRRTICSPHCSDLTLLAGS